MHYHSMRKKEKRERERMNERTWEVDSLSYPQQVKVKS